MTVSVTSKEYPAIATYQGHSLLTGRLITMGRVVECSKGFLPQALRDNKWKCVGTSMPSLEDARDYLYQCHYQYAQKKRGWTDEQLNQEILKAQEKNLELCATQ